MYRFSLLFVALAGIAAQAHAQNKADGVKFDELSRDFGSVPQGQILQHPFRVVNNTKQPVHINNVRVSCGICSSARALQTYLLPGHETVILATMDTNRFIGTKTITIFVTFDQPREEIKLWMQANSRQDVTYDPVNGIEFGRVKRGSEAETKVNIVFLGGAQTKVQAPKSDSNYVIPALKQVQGPNGETIYEISAKLRKDTPAGKWYTDIWIDTNNSSMQRLRVPVTVEVEAPLTVNPSTVSLGEIKAGTESERSVIIRGARPFRIIGITGTDKQLQVRQTSNESKAVHVLTVTLHPMEPRDLNSKITVQTDLATGGDIEFNAQAKVVP